jgi:hypothetical protein
VSGVHTTRFICDFRHAVVRTQSEMGQNDLIASRGRYVGRTRMIWYYTSLLLRPFGLITYKKVIPVVSGTNYRQSNGSSKTL